MLRTLLIVPVVLVLIWLVGMVSAYTLGGLIHVLLLIAPIPLVIALILIIVRLATGRSVF